MHENVQVQTGLIMDYFLRDNFLIRKEKQGFSSKKGIPLMVFEIKNRLQKIDF